MLVFWNIPKTCFLVHFIFLEHAIFWNVRMASFFCVFGYFFPQIIHMRACWAQRSV